MYRSSLFQYKWTVLTALLVIILASGCGDNNSTDPSRTPPPVPSLSMTVEGSDGLLHLTVRNTGGAMTQPSPCVASFADGHSDTLMLDLGANDTLICQLSNIHGSVSVANEDWNLTATGEDCLCGFFQNLLGQINLASYVPSPLDVRTVVLCTYTTNLYNLAATNVTVKLLPTTDGLTLRYVFHNISGHLTSTSPGALCPDLSGTVTINSIVVTTKIDIGTGDNPPVTLGTTQATVNGLNVSVDGAFGFIVSYVLQWFQSTFTNTIESAVTTTISNQVPSDLSTLVKVNTDCAL